MTDPKTVLKEYDMPVPEDLHIKVVENADDCVHITLPVPPEGLDSISDEELSHAAGGCCIHKGATMVSGAYSTCPLPQ